MFKSKERRELKKHLIFNLSAWGRLWRKFSWKHFQAEEGQEGNWEQPEQDSQKWILPECFL